MASTVRHTQAPPTAARRISGYAPDGRVSYNQEQICLLNAFYPSNQAYNAQATVHLKGHLDIGCLERAVSYVIRRHEVLRTAISLSHDGYRAVVQDPFHFRIPYHDLSTLPATARRPALTTSLAECMDRVFDIEQPPLLSLNAVRLGADEWRLVHVEHHVVHDGWSFATFWREVQSAYNSLASGKDPDLPAVPAQYQQFVAWQRTRMEGAYGREAVDSWCRYLNGAAVDGPPEDVQRASLGLDGHGLETKLSAQVYGEVRDAARRLACSPFVFLFSVFARLLAMRTGETDLTVGTAVSARTEADLDAMLGMVVNTIPIRVAVRAGEPIDETVRIAQASLFKALRYEDVPLSLIARNLGVTQRRGRNPVFQHCFSFHDSDVPAISLTGATGQIHEELSQTAKFETNIIVVPPRAARETNSARLLWQFARSAFARDEAVRFASDYHDSLERTLREL